MAVSKHASGTQTATISTEHTLDASPAVGVFTLHVDANAMASGDTLELRVYQMVLTGGTTRVVFLGTFTDAQSADDKIKVSVPISNDLTETNGLKFTLKQTAGVGRAFPWKILKHA